MGESPMSSLPGLYPGTHPVSYIVFYKSGPLRQSKANITLLCRSARIGGGLEVELVDISLVKNGGLAQ